MTSVVDPFCDFAGTVLDPSGGPPTREMVHLGSFSDVTEVFKSRDFVPVHGHRDSAPFLSGTVLSLSGEDHFNRRRIESALFRPEINSRNEAEIFMPALNAALARWPRDAPGRREGDLILAMRRALSALSTATVGLDGVDTEEAVDRHMLYTSQISKGVNLEFADRDHRIVTQESLTFLDRFRTDFLDPSWHRRQALVERFEVGEIGREALPIDLITLILLHRSHFAAFGPEAAVREVAVYNGASGGVTIAVCNSLTALLGWVAQDPSSRRPLLSDPEFVRKAALEAVRLRPATPFQIRKCLRSQVLSGGTAVAAGEFIVLDLTKATRDRKVFGADADSFNPMRSPVARIKPNGLAFSEGPHTCIAMSLSIGDGARSQLGSQGLLVAVLLDLFRRDVRISAASGPRRQDDTVRAEFDSFPISIAGWSGRDIHTNGEASWRDR